ncbi:MAG: LysR family transcriptional regulator ArgP [Glaciihabitans sp.]|nr:LysR family transcriptional regulator ArgP [Glaciihabitans sp.]
MFQVDQLQTLLVVVEEGTFDAAARKLRITASAVSQRVKAMEQAAGQVLLQRLNPVVPTAAGDVALRYARQLQLLEGDALKELNGLARSAGGAISLPLAVNADSLATWFLEALATVPRSVNAVFDIHREDQEHTTSLLRSGTVMAAVTSTAEAVQGCSSTPLGVMRYRAVCSPSFADEWLEGAADIHLLDAAPVVDFDRRDTLQRRFFRSAVGRELQAPRHYVPTSADFARSVVLGFGWALLPEQQCVAELAAGTLLELAPDLPVDVPLWWQRWRLASPLLDEVSQRVAAAAATSLHRMPA